MSVEFDWEINDEELEDENYFRRSMPPWFRWSLFITLILVVAAAGGGVWWQAYSAERQLRTSVQAVLDIQHQAFLQGDGDLFFSFFDPSDKPFQSRQLHPDEQAINALGLTVSSAQYASPDENEPVIWTNLTWEQNGESYQRIAFFEQSGANLQRIATHDPYWGDWFETPFEWGALRVRSADNRWVIPISQQIEAAIDAYTTDGEPFSRPTIVIRDDFDVSTLAHVIHYPSPRLLGLDEAGDLTEAYLIGLSEAVADHFRPITIRFAIPDHTNVDKMTIDFKQAAVAFAAQYAPRQIVVEVIIQEELSGTPDEWLQTVDAAVLPPTESLIAQGRLYDLTQLASSDSAFDTGDFYDMAWRGAWYEDRMWMVPWNTSLSLMFINSNVFRDLNIPHPSSDWTWDDLSKSLVYIAQQTGSIPFVDQTRETLYAYALSQDTSCQNRDNCLPKLTPDGVTAALEWYRLLALENETLRDVSALSPEDRNQAVMRSLSARKDLAMWVDAPMRFEYQTYLQPTGVMALPSISAESPRVMPVRINGIVMSQSAENTFWTWQWIKYVSHLTPAGHVQRNIPARPSVARQSAFFAALPEALGIPIQQVLPFARPILIGEERVLTWEMLDAAVNGDISPEPSKLRWFDQP